MTFIYFLSDDDPLKIAEVATVAMVTSSANAASASDKVTY